MLSQMTYSYRAPLRAGCCPRSNFYEGQDGRNSSTFGKICARFVFFSWIRDDNSWILLNSTVIRCLEVNDPAEYRFEWMEYRT